MMSPGGPRSPGPLAGQRMAPFFKREHRSLDNTNFLEGAGGTDRQPEHFRTRTRAVWCKKHDGTKICGAGRKNALYLRLTYRSSGSYGYED